MIEELKRAFLKNKIKLILAAILLVIFFMHLPGLFYGWPLKNSVGDEVTAMSAIFKMLNDHTLRPNFPSFYHLPIVAYAQLPFYVILLIFLRFSGLFASFASLKTLVILNYGYFLPFARFLTVLFAVAASYIIYLVGRKLFKKEGAGLVASFLLAFNFMFFQVTHFARAWGLQILLLLLAVYFYLLFFEKKQPVFKDYLLVGIFTGLAFGVHLTGAFIYIIFIVMFLAREKTAIFNLRLNGYWQKYKYFWALQLIIAAFCLLYYYLNPFGFLIYFQQLGIEKSLGGNWSFLGNLLFYAKVFWSYDWWLAILSLPALVLFYSRYKVPFWAFMSFIVLTVGGIAYSVHAEPRFIIAAMPFLILPVSYLISEAWVWLKEKWQKMVMLVVLTVAVLYLPVWWDLKIIKPNTLVFARQWILNSVPSGSKILTNDVYIDLPENQEAAQAMRSTNSVRDTLERQFISTADPSILPQPRYFVLTASTLKDLDSYQISAPIKFDYLIVSFWNQDQQIQALRAFDIKKLLVKEYYPTKKVIDLTDIANDILRPFWTLEQVQMSGPYVEIYKISN